MTKIKINRTQKTKEAIAAEFAHLEQQQQKMLLETMWTQLPDSGLKLSIMFRWQVWRTRLRALKQQTFVSPEQLSAAISAIKDSQPPLIYADTMEPVIAPLVMIRTDSVDQCIRSIVIAAEALKCILSERFQRRQPFAIQDFSCKLDQNKTVDENLEIFYGFLDNGY